MPTPFYPGQTDYIDQLNLLWDRATISLFGTSTTSNSVTNGSKTFTTQTNLQFTIGSQITVTSTVSPANYLQGQVTAYSQTTGVLTFTAVATGSGTFTSWSIALSGSPGPQGPQGDIGATGPANSLSIGSVTQGAAAATITGTAPTQTLNLTLPPGPSNSLAIGTVTQGTAAANITGTAPSQTLNLTLPKGDKGTVFRGAWVTATSYIVDDLTTNAGRTYICILTALNLTTIPGSDPTHWSLFAEKGADGTGANVQVLEEGVSLTTAVTSIDFVGARLTATNTGTSVTVTTNDQTITLTGDVTGSGTGSFATTIPANSITTAKILDSNITTAKIADVNVTTAKIADANVTTAKIADANVTLAKLANITTASILGRNTAATGVPEVLSAATTKVILALDNVNNTADTNKPVSSAQQTALDLKLNKSGGTMTGDIIGADNKISQIALKDTGYTVINKGNSGTATQTFDFRDGSSQILTATGSHTFAFSDWPPTGNLGIMLLELIDYGAYTITPPTITWTNPNGTETTSLATHFSALAAAGGRSSFTASGVTKLIAWSNNAGATVYGRFI